MTTKPIRIRRKTDTTTDDPAWVTSQIDPTFLRFTVANAEAGVFSVVLTPEDTSIAALTISFTATDGSEDAVAAGLAARANVLAATSPGWGFLLPSASISASAVLALAIAPGAPLMTASVVDPGSATLTPEHTGIVPVVSKGDGVGNLEIKVFAIDTDDLVLAPGSGAVTLELVSINDRTQPRGPSGPDNEDAGPAVTLLRSVTAHPLNTPWVVPCPAGLYSVRISTDVSLPGGTVALDVWDDKVEAPVTTVYSENIAAGAVGTDELADLGVTTGKLAADAVTGAKIADDAIDSEHVTDGAIDPVHLATTGARIVAADGAVTLAATDQSILLAGKTAGAVGATMTATHNGHRVQLTLFAASGGGSYTLAASTADATSGTVTLNAAGEGVDLARVGGVWYVERLIGGATFA